MYFLHVVIPLETLYQFMFLPVSYCIHLVEDRDCLQVHMNMVMNLLVS